MNIHQLDLNRDSFFEIIQFGEPEMEILLFYRRNLMIKKTVRIFETKAAISFLMPQGVLCLK